MDIIKAEFVVTTPMFLGAGSRGANTQPDCADGIRGASVKGALRATYRALNWSRIRLAAPDDNQALHQLHAEEAAIFGSAAKDSKGGQAAFLLRVHNGDATPVQEMAGKNAALEYLLGMGLFHFRDGLLRDHIPAETTFKLELALKPSLSAEQKQQVQDTLLFWGLTGGLGSRARKGFGSVSIASMERAGKTIELPDSADAYKDALKRLIGSKLASGAAPLTAFCQHSKIQLSGTDKNALTLLSKHAKEMALYRGYGRDGKTLGQTAEKNFKQDHDWAYDLSKRSANEAFLPKRAVFGLPHPYFLSGPKFKVDVDASTGRRASPLFAHVHRLPDGSHVLLHTLYRSQFLPERATVNVGSKAQRYTLSKVEEKVDWAVLEKFLQRFNPKAGDVIHG